MMPPRLRIGTHRLDQDLPTELAVHAVLNRGASIGQRCAEYSEAKYVFRYG